MAEKRALVNYNGKQKELATGDTLYGAGGSSNIAKTLLVPTGSEIIADNTVGITSSRYAITGSLSLTIQGTGVFKIS